MRICLDIDDTITYAPKFFTTFVTSRSDVEVLIVSVRDDVDEAIDLLQSLGVRWDRLILSSDPELGRRGDRTFAEWKADVINALQPDWVFEDMPEINCLIEPSIQVFMPCDDTIREWLREALNRND